MYDRKGIVLRQLRTAEAELLARLSQVRKALSVLGEPEAEAALAALAELPLLAPGARVVVEHSRRESLPEACGGLTRLTVRRYGDTQVAFYLMAESARQEHD